MKDLSIDNEINESNINYKTKPKEDLTLLSDEDLINILSNYRENKRRFFSKYQQEN